MTATNPLLFIMRVLTAVAVFSPPHASTILCGGNFTTTKKTTLKVPTPCDEIETFVLLQGMLLRGIGVLHTSTTTPTDASTSLAPPEDIKANFHHSTLRGHAGYARTTATNPFLFIVQVRKAYTNSLRSKKQCLFLLQCPRSLLVWSAIHELSKKLLLLRADFESNPGPTLKDVMKNLDTRCYKLEEIKTSQQTTLARIDDIETNLKELCEVKTKIDQCTAKVELFETNLSILQHKCEDLENHTRRNN